MISFRSTQQSNRVPRNVQFKTKGIPWVSKLKASPFLVKSFRFMTVLGYRFLFHLVMNHISENKKLTLLDVTIF